MPARRRLILTLLVLTLLSLACRFTSPTPCLGGNAQRRGLRDRYGQRAHQPLPGIGDRNAHTAPAPAEHPFAYAAARRRPWLIYPGADGQHLFAADLQADLLPAWDCRQRPCGDLKTGISPDGRYLLLRTGVLRKKPTRR